MKRLKKYHPPGTPPGTLSNSEKEIHYDEATVRLFEYDENNFQEIQSPQKDQCLAAAKNDLIDWIDVTGHYSSNLIRDIGDTFNLHPLTLEDVLNTGQRPKIDFHSDYVFIVLNLPTMTKGDIHIEQISLFIIHNHLLSFCTGSGEVFNPIRERLRKGIGRIRTQGVGYLLYSLMDVVIDSGFPIIEKMGETVEMLEQSILEYPDQSTLSILHQIKSDLLFLRRSLWPQREVINRLLQSDLNLVDKSLRPYFNDCYDHIMQIIDLIEVYREMLGNLLDLYLSGISNRLNEVMRVLTLISTIFIPLTFIVGVYGMNFKFMPELEWRYGYISIWIMMITVTIIMLVIFKRKRWI